MAETSPTTTGETELLTCVPEWCEAPGDSHEPTCPEAGMQISKAEFVASAEQGARMAIETYRMLIDDGHSPDDALETAITEAHEGSVCFAGIGSCGRGWCNHS